MSGTTGFNPGLSDPVLASLETFARQFAALQGTSLEDFGCFFLAVTALNRATANAREVDNSEFDQKVFCLAADEVRKHLVLLSNWKECQRRMDAGEPVTVALLTGSDCERAALCAKSRLLTGETLTCFHKNGLLHRVAVEGPAFTQLASDGKLLCELYFLEGKLHRPSKQGPAAVHYGPDGKISGFAYWEHGRQQRDSKDGPAAYGVTAEGLEFFEYVCEGEFHRDASDGPARFWRNPGTGEIVERQYMWHGKLHREGAPALISENFEGRGVRRIDYYLDGVLHRPGKEGPAVSEVGADGKSILEGYYEDGMAHRHEAEGAALTVYDPDTGVVLEESFCWEGKRHRENGPAVIVRDNGGDVIMEGWYRNGAPISFVDDGGGSQHDQGWVAGTPELLALGSEAVQLICEIGLKEESFVKLKEAGGSSGDLLAAARHARNTGQDAKKYVEGLANWVNKLEPPGSPLNKELWNNISGH